MILSDTHRFAFVHIPKCAGTSIRDQLRPYDSHDGLFTRTKPHPVLGELAYTHIPLDLLAAHFAPEFAKLRAYRSFAVLREPRARFGSAVRQYLRRSGNHLAELGPEEARETVLRLLDELDHRWNRADPRLVHFLPQRDFVFLGEEQIVEGLYPLERLDLLMEALSAIVGAPLDPEAKINRDYAFRSAALIRPAYRVNAFLWRHAPPGLHRGLKRLLAPLVTRRESAARRLGIAEMPEVADFVARHYARDAELHRTALAATAKAA